MSKQISNTFAEDFKKKFLLQFTKELIKNSVTKEVFELQKAIKEELKEKQEEENKIKKEIKKVIKEKKEPLSLLENDLDLKKSFRPLPINIQKRQRILTIPEPRLPQNLQYLKPIPTNKEIDLGTLNTLVKDFAVKIIECDGPETNILVRGNMGTKTTKIILTKEEINNLIQKFSKTAKIPAYEGIFRVVVGRLILLAIISEVVGSKFIIKKFAYNPFHQQK